MAIRLGIVILAVDDVERSTRFYRDALAFTQTHVLGARAGVSCRAPARALAGDCGQVCGVPANVAVQCALVAHAAPRPLGSVKRLNETDRAEECGSVAIHAR